MASITTRAGKGSPLTNAEVDANFTNINTELGQKLTGNQTVTLSGDVTGSGATAITATLANSGVTAGTYTKVTVDAKGRVTTGASLASGDLPTYTGTLTTSQVTTALGYTPYNETNPSGYITSSALSSYLPLSGGSLSGTLVVTAPSTAEAINLRGRSTDNIAELNYRNNANSVTYGRLRAYASDMFLTTYGTIPLKLGTNGATRLTIDGSTGDAAFSNNVTVGGNQVLHAANYSSYALPLSGGTISGSITVSGAGYSTISKPSPSSYMTTLLVGTSDQGLFLTSNNAIIGKGAYYNNGWIATSTMGSAIDFSSSDPRIFYHSGATVGASVAMSASYNILHAGNYTSYSPSLTGSGASGTWSINVTGSAGSASYASDYANYLVRTDNRIISPSESSSVRMGFGFTSWANNNTSPYADFLHMRSYSDASGGSDNLVMFNKSTPAMRIWQQSFGSSTAYSNYVDVLTSGNYTSYSPSLTGSGASGTWGISITGSSASTTGNAATATALQTARAINGVSFNGTADITVADSTKLPLAGGTMTGAITFAAGQTWPTFNQSTTGSAATLTTGRTIALTGDVTGTSGAFNGSANLSFATTLANSGVTAGTYTKVTVDAKGRATSGTTLSASDIPVLTMASLPGAAYKQSVRCATTANITLSGTQTIDGIAVVAGDRVLVKDQTTASQNGIYVVNASTWTRSTDADAADEIGAAVVNVDSGTANGGELWTTTFKITDTLGTTAMNWYEVLYNTGTWGISISGSAATLTTGRTIGMTGDVTWTSGSFNGSANVTGTATLANSGVTAGTYTKVTVDAKGRVTTGASLASGDLPTYTGSLTSSQVTTALGFTPLSNATSYLPLSGGTMTGAITFAGAQTWPTFNQNTTGSAATLTTARTIALSGAATGTATSFNGSANITIPVTALDASNLSAGTVPDARLTGTYSGFSHKIDGSNTVFTTPNSGSTSTSGRTVYGLAEYKSDSSAQVGAIVFIAPSAVYNTMHQLEVQGMLYSQNIFRMTVQGYSYLGATTAWADVRKISFGTVDIQTRWAYTPDGKPCLILGDVGTTWSYPHISIVRAMFSHSGSSDAYCSGWTVAIVTSLTGYQSISSTISDSSLVGSITGNSATATTLATGRTIGMTGDVTWTSASFNGSANVTGTATLANSGVTAGTYTKVTVDAKGRVTSATTIAAGDIPTLNQNTTGSAATLTTARTINGTSFNGSANITTANWGTARTLTIGSTGKSVDGSANVSWSLSEIGAPSTTDAMMNRGSVALASQDTATLNGFYTRTNTGDSSGLLVFNPGGSVGPWQMHVTYSGVMEFRNKTDSATWNSWKQVLHSANYTSYSPSLTGSGASGSWGISVTGSSASCTGNAATATTLATARTINGTSFNGSANITTSSWGTARTLTVGNTGKSVSGSANVSWTLAEIGALPLSGGTLTGLPIVSSSISSVTNTGSHLRLENASTQTSIGFTFGGTAKASIRADSAGAFVLNSNNSQFYFNTDFGGTTQTFYNQTTQFLSVTGSAATFQGDLTANGNVTAYSDERVKANWRSVRGDFIEALAAVKSGIYDRTDIEVTQAGVSAQSLRPVLSETVIESAEGELSVAYGNAALVAAVELAKELVQLKRELAELKSKLH